MCSPHPSGREIDHKPVEEKEQVSPDSDKVHEGWSKPCEKVPCELTRKAAETWGAVSDGRTARRKPDGTCLT